MIILKFGGTSVSTPERLKTISDIVEKELDRQPVVVVSAIRGVTDLLLSLAEEKIQDQKNTLQRLSTIHETLIEEYFSIEKQEPIIKQIHQYISEISQLVSHIRVRDVKLKDQLVSYGEIMSSYIVAQALSTQAIQVIATDVIVTDDHFGSADFIPEATCEKARMTLSSCLEKNIVPVVTGFIGATQDGQTTTLGRGGSDYSAAIIGYALAASEIQIWTDVDGIFSTDPRMVKNAVSLSYVSYREASELAAFGAKVLHPRTIRPAVTVGIPVRVCNTLNPEGQGTVISGVVQDSPRIAAIASKEQVRLINLYSTAMLHSRGFLERIFAVFARYNISVDLVSVSEVSVSVTLDNDEHLNEALKELETFTQVNIRTVGVVSLIGEKVGEVPSIMRSIFTLLEHANIPVSMMSLGASEINISLVIATEDVALAVTLLHQVLIERQISVERRYL